MFSGLSEAVETLPEALHSCFPDICVDFLHSIFKDEPDKELSPLSAKQLEVCKNTHDRSETAKMKEVGDMPDGRVIEAAWRRVQEIEREIARMRSDAVPEHREFEELLKFSRPAPGGGPALLQCEKCGGVMYAAAAIRHSELCRGAINKERHKIQSEDVRDAEPFDCIWEESDLLEEKRARCRKIVTKKKKPGRKPKNAVEQSININEPLSPILAAAAESRQARSSNRRKRRKVLTFSQSSKFAEPTPERRDGPASLLGTEREASDRNTNTIQAGRDEALNHETTKVNTAANPGQLQTCLPIPDFQHVPGHYVFPYNHPMMHPYHGVPHRGMYINNGQSFGVMTPPVLYNMPVMKGPPFPQFIAGGASNAFTIVPGVPAPNHVIARGQRNA